MTTSLTFTEPARPLPVLDQADVLVLGGGPGGVSAAVAAARTGARTILVERFGCFGGTWTSGILSAIMPFPFVKGIFEEITDLLKEKNSWNPWGKNYGCGASYDTEAAKIVLDQFVTQAGVKPYFFAQASGVLKTGSHIDCVIIESKEGRQVITAKQFIDSTGDGDISSLAGVPFSYGRAEDHACQPMTMIFKMEGVQDDRAQAYLTTDPRCAKAWQAAKAKGEVTNPREDVLLGVMPKPGQWNFNATRILGKNASKIQDVTEATIEARRQVDELARFMRKYIPGFENAVVSETAPHIGVRESRRIHCDYTITADDVIKVPLLTTASPGATGTSTSIAPREPERRAFTLLKGSGTRFPTAASGPKASTTC